MTNLASFGNPARFEISARWTEDPEPREWRPAHGGWSTGELRLVVGDYVLTHHEHDGKSLDTVRWYLLPVFEWLAENWVSLLHEERFTWRENSAAPAATAAFLALRRLIDVEDNSGQAEYSAVQAWWARHALRAADPSALYPDVFFRRFGDDVEISWTSRQPTHAPDGFRFALSPGAATLPISDVAGPLWEALTWATSTAVTLSAGDRQSVARLDQRIANLESLSNATLEASYLPSALFRRVTKERKQQHLSDDSIRMPSVPAISKLEDAVLMFGGASPDIGVSDIKTLTGLLASQTGGQDSPVLVELVDYSVGAPLTAPFEEGYELAEQLLEELRLPDDALAVDVRSVLLKLGVIVLEQQLCTNTIRGIALAGASYAPAILINSTSPYNEIEAGKRFTLSHELCHILYDRSRARRIAHTSGPWAAPGVEKRANAFAAMFLMPRELMRKSGLDDPTQEAVVAVAQALQVGVSALIEHLYNTSMIDELKREELRTAFRASS